MKETMARLGRRSFFRVCMSTLSLIGASPYLLAQNDSASRSYNRVRLVTKEGQAVTSERLKQAGCLIFNYPYVTTPCFLIDLGKAVNPPAASNWPGGSGRDRSVVCYSAICAHKQTYPARSVSFINFRPEEISYRDHDNNVKKQSALIYCCSESSVYDPARGARVMGGPAPVSLTTILLDHDAESDHYYATGTMGVEQYEAFFDRFTFRVALENGMEGGEDIRTLVRDATRVYTPEEYSMQQVSC